MAEEYKSNFYPNPSPTNKPKEKSLRHGTAVPVSKTKQNLL